MVVIECLGKINMHACAFKSVVRIVCAEGGQVVHYACCALRFWHNEPV